MIFRLSLCQFQAYLLVNVEVLDINDPPDFGSATLEIGTSVVSAMNNDNKLYIDDDLMSM